MRRLRPRLEYRVRTSCARRMRRRTHTSAFPGQAMKKIADDHRQRVLIERFTLMRGGKARKSLAIFNGFILPGQSTKIVEGTVGVLDRQRVLNDL